MKPLSMDKKDGEGKKTMLDNISAYLKIMLRLLNKGRERRPFYEKEEGFVSFGS